jgi:hypothetical protein
MDFAMTWSQSHGFFVRSHSLRRSPHGLKCDPEIEPQFGVFRLPPNRSGNQFNRQIRLACFTSQDAEQLEGAGVRRLFGQNLPTDRLSLGPFTGAVTLTSRLHRTLD